MRNYPSKAVVYYDAARATYDVNFFRFLPNGDREALRFNFDTMQMAWEPDIPGHVGPYGIPVDEAIISEQNPKTSDARKDGILQAQTKHLEDMRIIAFHALNATLP